MFAQATRCFSKSVLAILSASCLLLVVTSTITYCVFKFSTNAYCGFGMKKICAWRVMRQVYFLTLNSSIGRFSSFGALRY